MTARPVSVRLLGLAWPVALARLGIMGMGVVDSIVVGQLAPRELPHQALGWAPTAIFVVACVVVMFFNYLGYVSQWVEVAIWVSLAVTVLLLLTGRASRTGLRGLSRRET